ncbi:MAG: phosphatase PAP2 family protein [Candidatus Kapaibacterium sp.]|nr:MAG: phosphatase PAP2 family protein [Candidatus Kapabacteria bacterium]
MQSRISTIFLRNKQEYLFYQSQCLSVARTLLSTQKKLTALFFLLFFSAFSQQSFAYTFDKTSSLAVAPDSSSRTAGEIFVNDFNDAFKDGLGYVSRPLRFSTFDWFLTSSVIAGSIAFLPNDEILRRQMQMIPASPANVVVAPVAAVGRIYGETLVAGGIAAAIYGGGLLANEDHVRVTGRLALEALVYGGALNLVFKSAFGRSRPFLEEGAMRFQPLQFTNERTSFPSGHATVAFAVSTVLAERIYERTKTPWASIGLYSLAAITALSRMYHDVHWASDVFLGSAIGIGAGLAVVQFERERRDGAEHSTESHSPSHSSVSPSVPALRIFPTLNGLALVYSLP